MSIKDAHGYLDQEGMIKKGCSCIFVSNCSLVISSFIFYYTNSKTKRISVKGFFRNNFFLVMKGKYVIVM